MEAYKKPMLLPLKHIPTIFWALVSLISVSIAFPTLTHAYETQPTIWVQVPQWSDDWENAPWYSVEGLKDVAPISKKTVVEKLQEIK